ncbi:MAG: hypothetical protein PHQ40_02520, partial [Anaerolineaceae bacterium]|nr:hypothetical protein [Anaerolineaceae bacterium]
MSTCPFCSLHCDDLCIDLRGGDLAGFTPHCELAEHRYRQALVQRDSSSPGALDSAAEWLRIADNPLIVIGSDADQTTVRSAISLAQSTAGRLVNADEDAVEALSEGMRLTGVLMGTLGEVKRGADQVVVCGADPVAAAPRIWDYLGEEKRNQVLQWSPSAPLEAIRWLRLLLRGGKEAAPEAFYPLAQRIQSAESGVFLVGPDWLGLGRSVVTELLYYVRELNQRNRWYTLIFSNGPNPYGV